MPLVDFFQFHARCFFMPLRGFPARFPRDDVLRLGVLLLDGVPTGTLRFLDVVLRWGELSIAHGGLPRVPAYRRKPEHAPRTGKPS